MNYDEFARMLYQTSIDSTTTSEVAIRRLTPLRNWIKANVPNKLYRYRRPTAYNLDTLRTDEIWGSTILECNDPYECTPCYNAQIIQEFLNTMLSPEVIRQIIALLKAEELPASIGFSYPETIIDEIKKQVHLLSEEELLMKFQESAEKIREQIIENWNLLVNRFFMGITQAEREIHIACFSEVYDSTLMWGHYADSHKGFCLEYDFSAVVQDCSMNCTSPAQCKNFMLNWPIAPVTYSQTRLDATSYLMTVIQAHIANTSQTPINVFFADLLLLSKCQLWKSIDWAYEKEWRLAYRTVSEKYEGHRPIAKLKPTGVYMGSMMNPQMRNEIYGICQEREIPCYIMLQNFTGFDYTLDAQPYEEFSKASKI